jgi:hypothetical protein
MNTIRPFGASPAGVPQRDIRQALERTEALRKRRQATEDFLARLDLSALERHVLETTARTTGFY